jgi:hypothetical protein
MQPRKWFYYTGFVLLTLALAACSKMDATYDEFRDTGEMIYVGKVDSVQVQPGNNRVQLYFLLLSDPKISKYKVYWNNRNDSLINDVLRGSGVDTIRVIVDKNLKEGPNNFEIYTYDKLGHSSMKVEALGNVYAGIYQEEIDPRALKPVELTDDGTKVRLTWFSALPGEVRTEITYTDEDDVIRTVVLTPGQSTIEIPDYKEGGVLSYKTLYLPEPNAIDTFQVAGAGLNMPMFERKLDKSLFREKVLPTDVPSGFGWVMPRLWDNNIQLSFATQGGSGVNRWFTFDLGSTQTLSKYRIWQTQDRMYKDENSKQWEIWGSNDPAADGSTTNWTLLMTCNSIKPSGLPLGQKSAADEAFAAAGQEFIFPDGLPPVRYIRMRSIVNYGLPGFQTFGEISFWTKDR